MTPVRGAAPGRLRDLSALGVDFFQIRDRDASDREFEALLDRLASEAPEVLGRVLVNDRLALAASFPVAGVHLPETGFPASAVRACFSRERLLVGRSVHSVAGAVRSAADGADYLILGPFAPTRDPVTGPKPMLPRHVFQEAAAAVPVPVWAVGGLFEGNVRELRGTGVAGAAAIRAFADPGRARRMLEAGRRGPGVLPPDRPPVSATLGFPVP